MQTAIRMSSGSFSQRIISFLAHVDIRRPATKAERNAIFRLRYEAYVRAGAIERNFARTLIDGFDDDPNAWLFGLYVAGRLASSIRIHVASPSCPRSPAVFAFRDILMPEIEKGAVIVDPSRFVADADLARRYPELPYATVRLGFVACEFFEADLGLATVRPEHQAFYKRLFGLDIVCEPRTYPSLLKPLSLMAASYAAVRDEALTRYPFLTATPEELDLLFGGHPAGRFARPSVHERAVAPPKEHQPARLRHGHRPRRLKPADQADRAMRRSQDTES